MSEALVTWVLDLGDLGIELCTSQEHMEERRHCLNSGVCPHSRYFPAEVSDSTTRPFAVVGDPALVRLTCCATILVRNRFLPGQ